MPLNGYPMCSFLYAVCWCFFVISNRLAAIENTGFLETHLCASPPMKKFRHFNFLFIEKSPHCCHFRSGGLYDIYGLVLIAFRQNALWPCSSFVTKWDSRISREPFEVEPPNFTRTFIPIALLLLRKNRQKCYLRQLQADLPKWRH